MSANELAYLRLANDLEREILTGHYRAGEKLPSLRAMRRRTGRSMATVYHAYTELEERGVVDVREKSGFYIRPAVKRLRSNRRVATTVSKPHQVTVNGLATILQQSMDNPEMLPFGSALPGPELLPGKQLGRVVRSVAARYSDSRLLGYGPQAGLAALRTEIEKRMVGGFNEAAGDEIIITGGCMAAIDLCLRSVARGGDVILVESPTFLCYLQLIEDLDMRALEIPVDADTGIDLRLLRQALTEHPVKAALINGNFQNPLGYVMSDKHKAELVALCREHRIPLIEDDIYGDLYFGNKRPRPLKSFDTEGLVLYCSSFTKTLAPDLRIGWTVPGQYREKVKRLKFNASVGSNQLMQQVVAEFLSSGAYDRHLRKLRNNLRRQLGSILKAITDYFPASVRVSAPHGGLCLWVELGPGFDSMELFDRAKQENISLLPGTLCSTTTNFSNCIRLNFGYPWSDSIEAGIRRLGEIITDIS